MRILVTDGMDKNAVSSLIEMGHEVIEKHYEKEQLGKALQTVDAVVIRSATKIRKESIDEALETSQLKVIIRAGVGIDNIDHEYAKEKGIKVNNTPYASSAAVAELAIGHMFALTRFIYKANITMREGKWEKKKYKGSELGGKTLGLIGFGRIAKETASRAKALGMEVVYTNRSGEKKDYPQYKYVDMEELLKTSDFISLHIPFNKEAGPVIKEEEFSNMKDRVYIINTARGGVVDEKALLNALNSNKVAGAAIDVFEEEPTNNTELVNHENVCVTPHIGASTREAQERIGIEIINIIKSMEA